MKIYIVIDEDFILNVVEVYPYATIESAKEKVQELYDAYCESYNLSDETFIREENRFWNVGYCDVEIVTRELR